MDRIGPGESRRLNANPIRTVSYTRDLPYARDRLAEQRLDVLVPSGTPAGAGLPVYVYFHGGGWTSGDKAAVTKYGASQAVAGMVVVNANYRRATTAHHMHHMIEDANAVLGWVRENIADFGGNPDALVVGGDSAGAQIAALTTALPNSPELADHYGVEPAAPRAALRGLVQHCSMADFRLVFERGFIMSRDFVRLLLPDRGRGLHLQDAAHFLSPVEWITPDSPPTLVTSSTRDFLYRANLNLADRVRRAGVPLDTLFLGREARNARHTWQQNAALAESQPVYQHLQHFVARVAGSTPVPAGPPATAAA